MTPLILDALLEIGCLLAAAGDGHRAVSILRFLLAQAQLSERHRQRSTQVLATLSTTPAGQAEPSLEHIVALVMR